MTEYTGGLAERIVLEGKVLAYSVHCEESLSEKQLDILRERVVTHVIQLFQNSVEITHCDKTVSGAKLYIDPPEQLAQVRAEVIDLPYVEKAYISQRNKNCLILLFRTTPSLGCADYFKTCIVLSIVTCVLLYALSVVSARDFPEAWPIGSL